MCGPPEPKESPPETAISEGHKPNATGWAVLAGVSEPCRWTGPGQGLASTTGWGGEGREAAPPPFLVPRGNNSIGISQDPGRLLTGGQRFEIEILSAVAKFGAHRVGLWTSTPGELGLDGETFRKVQDWREASRRWDSLNSNCVAKRPWIQWAMVMQRHKDGGVHYHVCVVHQDDIRGSIDFAAVKRRNYRSVTPALRAEWAYWRVTAPKYGFGRVELLPVKDAQGFGRYLARYLKREIGSRRESDTHAQLFRFSRSWSKAVVGEACWSDTRAQRAMRRAAEVGKLLWGSENTMVAELGPQWKWKLKRILWCRDDWYEAVLLRASEFAECHGGAVLCLDEAFAFYDARKLEADATALRLGKSWSGGDAGFCLT